MNFSIFLGDDKYTKYVGTYETEKRITEGYGYLREVFCIGRDAATTNRTLRRQKSQVAIRIYGGKRIPSYLLMD